MDLHSSYDLLRLTPPDLPTLSFTVPQPNAMRAWLDELPKANLGEISRRLYLALQELNRLQTSPAKRLQLLELIEPEVLFACGQLQKHLRSPLVILDERRQQIADLRQTLLQQLARAAKLTASEALALPSSDLSRQLGSRALLLALQALYQLLCQFSMLYTPPPQGFWLELHKLCRVAASHRLGRLPLPAPGGGEQTIEQCYLACLLLGSARCNQLRQQAILQLGEALPGWSTRACLQEVRQPGSLFAFAPATDSPPRHAGLLHEEDPSQLLGLNPQGLVRELRAYLQMKPQQRLQAPLKIPHGIGDSLLQHLCAAWGAPTERAFPRLPGNGSLSVCLGISALHYQIAGQRSFAASLQLPDSAVSVDFQRHERDRDPWKLAFDTARDEALLHQPHKRIDYTPGNREPAEEAHEPYPCHQLQVINHSPGGYCLAWDDTPPEQLQAGDLIGLQPPGEQGWSIALIRWIHQPHGSHLQLGVELIAPRAQPCGLRPLNEGGPQGQYLRGLLLTAIPALGRPATLIAPHLPFQLGQKVLLNLDGQEQLVQLTQRHALSGSFNQFEYRCLEAAARPEAGRKPVTALHMAGEPAPVGFDSLWESL